MTRSFRNLLLAAAALLVLPAQATSFDAVLAQVSQVLTQATGTASATSAGAPKEPDIEIAFSPNQGALDLVIKNIASARSTLDVMAYSFTSAEVTRALLQAVKRGVNVRLIIDQEQNFKPGNGYAKTMSAMSALGTAGAQIRVISRYPSFHHKVAISDGKHVQTGSFNYSHAAATRNAENVIVLWNAPQAARIYSRQFENHWNEADPFQGRPQR